MATTDFSMIVRLPEEGLTRHDLSGDSISLGRSPDNDIQILVSEVSVKHAQFTKSGDSLRLVDPGSTNGTIFNGARVGAEGVEVSPMAKIIFGATIDAYLVPSAVLDSTPMEELAKSIDENAAAAPTPQTAPVAANPAAPGGAKPAVTVAAPAPASSGAQTVKLEQVKPFSRPEAPAAPGAPKIAAPVAPAAPAAPGGAAPAAPQLPTPGGAAPAAPQLPTPGGAAPAAPGVAPLPLKKPAPGGGAPAPVPPNAPNIPLPKRPSNPGGES